MTMKRAERMTLNTSRGARRQSKLGRESSAVDSDLASGSSQVDSLRDCPLYCSSLYTWLHGVYIMEYSGNS